MAVHKVRFTQNLIWACTLQEGYGEFQVTHSKGERADCFRMYLKPIMARSNLTVLTDAKTLKIETEEAAGTTVTRGVTFQQAGPDGSKLQGGLRSFKAHATGLGNAEC